MADQLLTAATFVEKGGVGKSTTAAHVARDASDRGHDVLLLDLAGTQNDLATQFGLDLDTSGAEDDDIEAPISAVFSDQWELIESSISDVLELMTFATGEGVDLIPADAGLSGADANLNQVPTEERFSKLSAFVADHVAPEYDLLVIDLPGAESNIALNGLFAAENVIAPLKPGAFEADQLERLAENLAAIREREDYAGVNPELVLVLPTMIDRRESLSEEFVEDLREEYPEVSGPPVVRTANVSDGQQRGETLFAMPDEELYGTGERARAAYHEAAGELLGRLGGDGGV